MKLDKLTMRIIAIVAVIIILAIISYALFNSKESSSSCMDVSEGEKAACCAAENKDAITISCVGNWGWDSDLNECSFFCDMGEEVRFCAQDVIECADGSFVGRDPGNNCEFKPCLNAS